MSGTVQALTLTAALVSGLAGNAHCFGMCGGMASALGIRARLASASRLHSSVQAVLYHIGRITGYASIGALAGAAGSGAQQLAGLARIESALRIAAALVMLLLAARLLSGRNLLSGLERFGSRVWLAIRPAAQRASRNSLWYGPLLAGLLWGWLPCGLVYSMLLMTLTTASATEGAAVMLAFGVGTLPAMIATSLVVSQAPRTTTQPWFRNATGILLACFAAWLIAAPFAIPQHHH